MKISVILPCYNEMWRVPATLCEIRDFRRNHIGLIDEVIVVDDCSRDATVERCMRFKKDLPLNIIRLAKNEGKWAAIHEGMKVARNDWLLLLDADGSASIFELDKLNLSAVARNKVAVFGSRFMLKSTVHGKTILRTIVSRTYRFYVLAMYLYASGRIDVDDMQCPFKLINRKMLNSAFTLDQRRFAGDMELALALPEIHDLNIDFVHRKGSKLSLKASWEMFRETWRLAINYRKVLKAGLLAKPHIGEQQNI